jgi:Na+/proline symporter
MVATTFGADTPLLVTGLIGRRGIAGNWWWWSFVLSNVLTVFFFAKIWRRTGITTDVELSELRYGGAGGRWLRAVRAIYFGGLINVIVIGMIMVGGQGIVCTLFSISPQQTIELLGLNVPLSLLIIIGLSAFIAFYSTLGGLWGVVSTDLVQFLIALVGCVVLAIYVVGSDEVGGLSGLVAKLPAAHPLGEEALALFPRIGTGKIGISIFWFSTMMGAQWWASWYPGSEPGGGGYIVQRILASKDERAAQLSTLWFTVAHYAIRPWPWILVALAGFVIWPDTHALFPAEWNLDPGRARELTFIAAIPRFLPSGLIGLLVAALSAALMSTMDTHINWGSSYLVNDFYRRFLAPERRETHYVRVSRLCVLLTLVFGALLATFFLDNIQQANELVVSIGAGAGLVYILRWYWPRINAWSELSSMVGALLASQGIGWYCQAHPQILAGLGADDQGAVKLLANIVLTTVVWLLTTFVTRPESIETLRAFYLRCEPRGPWWRRFARAQGLPLCGDVNDATLLDWGAGCALVWSALLVVGKLLLAPQASWPYALTCLACAAYLGYRLRPARKETQQK